MSVEFGILFLFLAVTTAEGPAGSSLATVDECTSWHDLATQLSVQDDADDTLCVENQSCNGLFCSGERSGQNFSSGIVLYHCSDPVKVLLYGTAKGANVDNFAHNFTDGETAQIPGAKIEIVSIKATIALTLRLQETPGVIYISVIVQANYQLFGNPMSHEGTILDDVRIAIGECPTEVEEGMLPAVYVDSGISPQSDIPPNEEGAGNDVSEEQETPNNSENGSNDDEDSQDNSSNGDDNHGNSDSSDDDSSDNDNVHDDESDEEGNAVDKRKEQRDQAVNGDINLSAGNASRYLDNNSLVEVEKDQSVATSLGSEKDNMPVLVGACVGTAVLLGALAAVLTVVRRRWQAMSTYRRTSELSSGGDEYYQDSG
ncbi:PREDICTED: uncharacterized protein LOC106819858 [Priapulus caudatus]|uniref:Uncharacterized protein LOC106819858 n=1 Tax=Priapulus caudatus TaxID=37621 RepID=A0ABM1F649_PRICU|nr:PREDICTED: uncharacterized protein LOC106819858 [Priapulus caudatus]